MYVHRTYNGKRDPQFTCSQYTKVPCGTLCGTQHRVRAEAGLTLITGMRRRYLKEYSPGLYSSLILSEKLYPHLLEIDRAARERMDAMLPRMMEAAGVTEDLKARDPIQWVGLMNTLKAQIEETIITEIIME